jgi:hypothetical protein
MDGVLWQRGRSNSSQLPPPLGKDIDLRVMVDSDNVGEKRTRRSHTGFIIFCNLAPIIRLSKQQATIETSVFGAEFVAMKHGIETLRGLRYRICLMGIPLSLVGISVWNSAEFRNKSDSRPFELRNFHQNLIFPIVKCVPANSEHIFSGSEFSPAIYSSNFMNQKMFPLYLSVVSGIKF